MGALTDNHRCPSRLASRLMDAGSTVGVGGGVGILFCYIVDERPATALVLAAAALGSVIAMALRQAIGGRF